MAEDQPKRPTISVTGTPPPAPEEVTPITVAIARSSMTREGSPLIDRVELTTPSNQPNVSAVFVAPVVAIVIRFANAYMTTLVGLVMAGVTTEVIRADDFGQLVYKCLGLSLAGPSVSLGKDLITILGDLEKRWPLLTGKV